MRVNMQANSPWPLSVTWIYRFENRVIPDQLASEKPADQDPHCFPLC